MHNQTLLIIWYWPNIIGYFRAILVILCLFIPVTEIYLLVFFLATAGLLDYADGYVAKRLQQRSRFGAVLDYLTDRATTIVYIKVLCVIVPAVFASIFCLLFMVDITSHMARLYTTLWTRNDNHKTVASDFTLLQLYYHQKPVPIVMGICTHSYEIFFMALLLLHAGYQPIVWLLWAVLIGSFPGFIMKNIVHILQLIESFQIALLTE